MLELLLGLRGNDTVREDHELIPSVPRHMVSGQARRLQRFGSSANQRIGGGARKRDRSPAAGVGQADEVTSPGARLERIVAARDPGHARLVNATAVTCGVPASALFDLMIVQAFHAHPGMLSVSVFLSMLAGNVVKDQAPISRLISASLLIPAVSATNELRAALLAVIRAVTATGEAAAVRLLLARADEVGRSITQWQSQFPTENYFACTPEALETAVLDARVDTEEVVYLIIDAHVRGEDLGDGSGAAVASAGGLGVSAAGERPSGYIGVEPSKSDARRPVVTSPRRPIWRDGRDFKGET